MTFFHLNLFCESQLVFKVINFSKPLVSRGQPNTQWKNKNLLVYNAIVKQWNLRPMWKKLTPTVKFSWQVQDEWEKASNYHHDVLMKEPEVQLLQLFQVWNLHYCSYLLLASCLQRLNVIKNYFIKYVLFSKPPFESNFWSTLHRCGLKDRTIAFEKWGSIWTVPWLHHCYHHQSTLPPFNVMFPQTLHKTTVH